MLSYLQKKSKEIDAKILVSILKDVTDSTIQLMISLERMQETIKHDDYFVDWVSKDVSRQIEAVIKEGAKDK